MESRDVGAGVSEERGERVGGGDAQREDLPDENDNVEVDGGEVGVPFCRGVLEQREAVFDGLRGFSIRISVVVVGGVGGEEVGGEEGGGCLETFGGFGRWLLVRHIGWFCLWWVD